MQAACAGCVCGLHVRAAFVGLRVYWQLKKGDMLLQQDNQAISKPQARFDTHVTDQCCKYNARR
jgi:hypothetical protein